jgi:hypothetical protein
MTMWKTSVEAGLVIKQCTWSCSDDGVRHSTPELRSYGPCLKVDTMLQRVHIYYTCGYDAGTSTHRTVETIGSYLGTSCQLHVHKDKKQQSSLGDT